MRRILLDSMERREDTEAAVPVFTPSARHDREISAMLADPTRWVRRRTRPVWKSVLQRVAVILLVFTLSLGSLMAVSPTVRAAVIRWAVEWYENHITYACEHKQQAFPFWMVIPIPMVSLAGTTMV